VALVIGVVSRSRPGSSRLARGFTRRMQLRAHKLSIQNFLALLNGVPMAAPAGLRASAAASLLPLALLFAAMTLLMVSVFWLRRRE